MSHKSGGLRDRILRYDNLLLVVAVVEACCDLPHKIFLPVGRVEFFSGTEFFVVGLILMFGCYRRHN
jgi:hypothetical protein